MNQTYIYDQSKDQIRAYFSAQGQPAYRADQLWQALYRQLVDQAASITSFPKELRTQLADDFSFYQLSPIKTLESGDKQTRKTLLGLADGAAIEAVLMHYNHRHTICISTQVGCAMGCTFCATGQMGFQRQLTSGEIIAQVLYYARELIVRNQKLTNIVFMGMGEPFHNYDAVLAAADQLNDQEGFAFGARRMTISTAGLIREIRRFTREKRPYNLAVSLHATSNENRSQIMPVNVNNPLEQLIPACRDYTIESGRRISFEWALIRAINDSDQQARDLANLLRGMLCHVNLIPLNPTPEHAGSEPKAERVQAFSSILKNNGIPVSVRVRRGLDIQAGCGQLATESQV